MQQAAAIRHADIDDLDALVAIETASFSGDRLSRRSFRHLLTEGNCLTLVAGAGAALRGYATVLFRDGVSVARIYTIATTPAWQGCGVAAGLVRAAEQAALARGCVSVRLEIRKDNAASLALFASRGYQVFGEYRAYYEDGMAAWRLQKALPPHRRPARARAAYYRQTLGFTCGASCLMMAMKAFEPGLELNRTLELQLWREATTIFMTAGHGGCGPYGLALAAHRRGFPAEIHVNGGGVLFRESVRSEEKREVITLVHEDFVRQVKACPIPVHANLAGTAELRRCVDAGGVVLVLISTWRLTRERAPHWVVISACDAQYVYIHDPDNAAARAPEQRIDMPIPKKDFERMARYGRNGARAAVVVYPRGHPLPATA
ncbi:GNAT family N-acetyltransferase [Massilia atriviolacea]|uniref:GNAT family N-acetyltransferase n=1 Tax=Massilia atriviolacea TaxID=2495579 RepID=A0A430HQ14_9BURK|nr:GNAT family N-acetyltransferase/peptidase C39 family protein [Massilia atriviolacea]RSZ59605.1 GNAT family N-acetyltransferase [Massilia atriviolacea]